MSRIVVVGSLAYSLVNFRGRLLAAMVEAGHEVVACAPDDDPEVVRRLAELGVRFRRIPMARASLNPFADILTLVALYRLFAVERPDVVLAYTQKPIIYAGIAARLSGNLRYFAMVSGLGHAFSEGGSRFRPLLRRLVVTLYRAAVRRGEAVFVFNNDDRGELLRHGVVMPDTRVIQLPGSGVDLVHYGCRPPAEGPLVFLMIARLLASKGLREFVAAARAVRRVDPAAEFRLLGAIDENPASVGAREIAEWQADGTIRYLGETRDVRPHLASASVFVLPSWYREGLPRTILEAMATGRAVITTDMPGCRDPIVPDVTGLIVPPRDAAALTRACLRFVEDATIAGRMGAAARRAAEAGYGVERVNALVLGAIFGMPATMPSTDREGEGIGLAEVAA